MDSLKIVHKILSENIKFLDAIFGHLEASGGVFGFDLEFILVVFLPPGAGRATLRE